MTVRNVTVLVLLSLVAVGCRIDIGTDVTLDARGGGELAVSVRIDGATLRELDGLGIDPALDVEQTLGQDSRWTVSRRIDGDGGLILTYTQAFTDGTEATALLRELSEGVAPQDPAVRLDLRVVTTPRGAVRIDGTGSVVAPTTLGVSIDDQVVGPSGPELEALVAEAVRAELVVRVAGNIVSDDADVSDDRVARWVLPVGAPRSITLAAEGPSLWSRVPLWSWLAVLVALGVLALAVRRSRSTGPEVSPGGSGAP
jgi:hypothetical protein